MSADRYTFDTNVLFYALDLDSGQKYRTAEQLLVGADYNSAILLLQTLGELSHAIRRKLPGNVATADLFVQKLIATFDVVPSSAEDLQEAFRAHRQHGLPFWDAMLWSTARRAGCMLVLSEDFQDGRELEGVTFRNPFKMTNKELTTLLA